MGLTNSLEIGKSGLLASQTALQVAGSNLANISSRGYHRQQVTLEPIKNQPIGHDTFIGRGVQLQSITRQVNEALEGRLRASTSDQAGSQASVDKLSQVESIENELTDVDLSSRLTDFFNNWSQLANNPQDTSLRSLVVEQGGSLSTYLQDTRGELAGLQKQTDNEIATNVASANDLLTKIAGLNKRITAAEGGHTGAASGLRDQRGQLLGELSEFVDISTSQATDGSLDVFIGSLPVIQSGISRGIEARPATTDDGKADIDVVLSDDGSPLDIASGQIGALIKFRKGDLPDALSTLDQFAHQLIGQVNRLHSQGQGLTLPNQVTGAVKVADPAAALNTEDAGLDFGLVHGSFELNVTQGSTGQTTTSVMHIDLDGIDPTNDTSLNSLVTQLDVIDGVDASITPDNRLSIKGASGDIKLGFANDTSGVLGSLGVNTYFAGTNAHDIAVNPEVVADPRRIAASADGDPGDNANALAIAGLQTQSVEGLSGLSLGDYWDRHVEDFATRLSQAKSAVQADTVVRQNLQTQQQAISGVNADEETIDLLQYQKTYQASARFISVVDQLTQELLNLV